MAWIPPFTWEDLPALSTPINAAHLINYVGSLGTYVDSQLTLYAKLSSAPAGDLSGTYANPIVVAINGVKITGKPTGAGQVPISTSASAAAWGTPAGGGGSPTGAAGGVLSGTYPNPTLAAAVVAEGNLTAPVVTKLNEKGGGGAPTGAAGGSLAGTYPNPSIAAKAVLETNLAAAVVTKLNEKGGGAPTGPAGGVLTGNYPNPGLQAEGVAEGNISQGLLERMIPTGGLPGQFLGRNRENTATTWQLLSGLKKLGNVSGKVVLNVEEATTFTATLTGATEFELTVLPSHPVEINIIISQDATGGRTWSIKGSSWIGKPPTIKTEKNLKYFVEVFFTGQAGTELLSTAEAIEPGVEPPPPPPPTGLVVGINSGGWGSGEPADVHGAVNYSRIDDEHLPTTISAYTSAGVKVNYLKHGPYAPKKGVKEINATNWANEAKAFCEANPELWAIEILNEPGGDWFWGTGADQEPNPKKYAELCKKVKETLAPLAKKPLLLASYDGGHNSEVAWGERVYAADPSFSSYIDGLTMHPYGGSGSSRSFSAAGNRGNVERAFEKTKMPMYITELGWPTALKESEGGSVPNSLPSQGTTGDSQQWTEAAQAENIKNFLEWAKTKSYVKAVFIFGYRDADYAGSEAKAAYGIEKRSGAHKPSYGVLNSLREG